jgi:hypothetical protein
MGGLLQIMQNAYSGKFKALALALQSDSIHRRFVGGFPFASGFEIFPLRFDVLTFPTSCHITNLTQLASCVAAGLSVLRRGWMAAGSQLVVEYSYRRRLDDAVGLGLLALATMLSFTGLVDLARYMHPVRFVLLLSSVVCTYRVMTRTFARFRFTDAGIESHAPFRRPRRWKYDQLVEVRRAFAGKRPWICLRFSDGSVVTVDCSMMNETDLLAFLQERTHHFIVTAA